MKIVAMIPARLGSKRIKNKNLRLLGGKPLICHVLDTAKAASVFDDIYVNSEAGVFSDLADEYGVKFYKRPAELAEDDASNDMFVYDFLNNVDCDLVIQINPTSPFYTVEDIKGFVDFMVKNDFDTAHGVRETQIETIFKGKALNFDLNKIMPKSQELEPILTHAGGLMGWKKENYLANIEKFNSGTYGCDGKIGYYPLHGLSQIDIDYEDDFILAELALEAQKRKQSGEQCEKKYYESKKLTETVSKKT